MAEIHIAQGRKSEKRHLTAIVMVFMLALQVIAIVLPAAVMAETDMDRRQRLRESYFPPEIKAETVYFDTWTKAELGWLAASTVAMVVDWRQTRTIAQAPPEKYSEQNPFLGRNSSPGSVDAYFAVGLLGTALIAHALPHDLRKVWLISITTLSVVCVGNNIGLGVGMEW